MADSFSKKENFKKKLQKQKDKALRREERKTNNDKGKETEFMYVDAYGRLTSTPPEERVEVDLDDIQLGAAPVEAESPIKTGIVTFLSDKGYGFITENKTNENVFFHSNNCAVPVKKGNKVSFEKERSPKGFSAINIELVK
ncbi:MULTISPECIES: cold-shock protein [Epilithonimonas]|uniref:Cold shock domain-containing protein n=1 Tax=Epilithonimonas hispanica TaxID=358687 RepID=A0A3D9CU40_9FLAO|nr:MULTISPECIES: cold shock domain-containing protein [Epilithonimonas]REC69137.1 cold shock domain-containing protein [Epilithonimonas hispanica]